MAGYSGTPLPKKLGFIPGLSVFLWNAPPEIRSKLRSALAKSLVVAELRPSIDLIIVFARSRVELTPWVRRAVASLQPAGALWVCWPKLSSGVASDLGENVVRETGLSCGLVDVKVCAVSEIWSGLKFVRRLRARGISRPV